MQYWLLNYGPTCPKGWKSLNTQEYPDRCYKNSVNQAKVASIKDINELGGLTLAGFAEPGGDDRLIFTANGVATAFSNDDAVLDLAQNWTAAEFNVFGDCCADVAIFNAGANIVVSTAVDNGTQIVPFCDMQSFTGESNNLFLSGTPPSIPALPQPRVEFTESNPGQTMPSCTATAGITDVAGTVYRWYQPVAVDHFYTEDPTGELAPSEGYRFEGTPFGLFGTGASGTVPLFRWLCPGGHHFYTTDPEGENARPDHCQPEGILGNIATTQLPGTQTLYRFYDPSTNDHLYTLDQNGESAPSYHFELVVGFVNPGP